MTDTEYELIVSAKAGDEKAFERLIEGVLPRIRGSVCVYFGITGADMDDIIQRSLIKAWEKIKFFNGQSRFSTWFYSIVKNESISYFRIQKRICAHEVHGLIEDMEEDMDLVPQSVVEDKLLSTARSILETRESIEAYRQLINYTLEKLTPPHREIIQLALRDGNTYAQISKMLHIPFGTVMSRLYFARREAKNLINEHTSTNKLFLPHLGQPRKGAHAARCLASLRRH